MLFRITKGCYVGSCDGSLFWATDCTNVETIISEHGEIDGKGCWLLWGTTPDQQPYRWRFETLKECRDILGGMEIEFQNGFFNDSDQPAS